jgi:hypothetical protein
MALDYSTTANPKGGPCSFASGASRSCTPSPTIAARCINRLRAAKIVQTRSTQRERDHLLGGHRRAFGPCQFKHDIPKLST